MRSLPATVNEDHHVVMRPYLATIDASVMPPWVVPSLVGLVVPAPSRNW
jgi:hypothetical protein